MSDLAPGDLVRVFYAKSWHRAVVVERGPAPGFAAGWPGVACRGDMLKLLLAHGDLKTAGRPWDLMVGADSDAVLPLGGSADERPSERPRARRTSA